VTHPFHPRSGERYVLVMQRHTWGEQRVFFHDQQGQLQSLPTAWTSVAAPDPFVRRAAGRALFRPHDLLALARLCQRLVSAERRQEPTP
jgi:hypothetical protein